MGAPAHPCVLRILRNHDSGMGPGAHGLAHAAQCKRAGRRGRHGQIPPASNPHVGQYALVWAARTLFYPGATSANSPAFPRLVSAYLNAESLFYLSTLVHWY